MPDHTKILGIIQARLGSTRLPYKILIPLHGHPIIKWVMGYYFKYQCDYAYNHVPLNNTYPDSLGAEIISFYLLQHITEKAKLPRHGEHSFTYITDNPDRFSIRTFNPPKKAWAKPKLKPDVDTFEDYRQPAMRDYGIKTSTDDTIELFSENP